MISRGRCSTSDASSSFLMAGGARSIWWHFSAHLCVGFLFLILYPGFSSSSCSPPPPPPPRLCHTRSLSHIFHTHTFLHTIFVTHDLCHTPSWSHTHTLVTHNFVTHDLCTQLCHTRSLSHIFHKHFLTHPLSHTIFVTHHLCHTYTHLSHTQLCHTRSSPSFTHTAWQAWHLVTSRRGSLRGRQHLWHWAGDIYLHFAWQAWRLWRWAGSGGALGLGLVAGRRGTWRGRRGRRGRRGTWRHVPSFHVAGVALGDSHLRFVCQAWLALVACLGWD